MKFNPATGEPTADKPAGLGKAPMGIRGRVEAASKAHAPAPKGKGLVMMIIGVAVLGALIWDFTGRGAASQAVRKAHDDGKRPVPKQRPDGGTPAAAPRPTPTALVLRIKRDGALIELPPEAAASMLSQAPADVRAALHGKILAGIVEALRAGADGRQVFEAAARFQEGAENDPAIQQLILRALATLKSNDAAPAAILFLSRLPNRGGALTAAALDEVIVDDSRPLHVRLAAANARPDTPKPPALDALMKSPATHPALVDALK